MIPVHLLNELFDIDGLSLALIKRAKARINVGAQPTQLLDMRKKLAPNFFLVGVGQGGHFGDSFLQRFDHS